MSDLRIVGILFSLVGVVLVLLLGFMGPDTTPLRGGAMSVVDRWLAWLSGLSLTAGLLMWWHSSDEAKQTPMQLEQPLHMA